MEKVYKQCKACKKWVVWDYIDIDRNTRLRRCPKCSDWRKLPIQRIEFKAINGELYQSWRGGVWEKSSEVNEIYKELIKKKTI